MTVAEVAAALGIHRRAVHQRMVDCGWLVNVGAGSFVCDNSAVRHGCIEPIVRRRRFANDQVANVEVGFSITPHGRDLLASAGPPKPR